MAVDLPENKSVDLPEKKSDLVKKDGEDDKAGTLGKSSRQRQDQQTATTTAPTMAGAADNTLEQICTSCWKPMLSCACKRTKRTNVVNRDTMDDTPMEGVEEASTGNHTTSGNITNPLPGLSSTSASTAVQPQIVQDPLHTRLAQTVQIAAPPGLPETGALPSSSTTPVQPVTVQDPLHTGLSQSLHTTGTGSIDQQGQPATPTTAQPPTTNRDDAQQLYSGYIEDEILRSSELITAAYTTTGRNRPEVPTWRTLSTTTDSSAIRAVLTALAFNTESADSWNILGLSRLEGPKPTTHMLQSRRDVALKLIDSCTQYLHEAAQQEIHGIRQGIDKACSECCENLEANAQERKHLKGTSRIVPRWMEPSDDLLHYLTTLLPTDGRIALHMSNLTTADLSTYTNVTDVNSTRQIHTHLCGPPDEIERALIRLGDQPLLTWAPTDNGQLLKVAAAVRNIHNTRPGQGLLTLAVPFDPYPACDKVTDITDVWDHPLLHTKWRDVVVDVSLLTPPTRIVVSGMHAPIHAHKCISLFTLGQPSAYVLPRLTTWRLNFFSFVSGPVITVDTPTQFGRTVRGLITNMGLPALQTIDHPRPSLGNTKDVQRSTIQLHIEHGKLSPIHLEALLTWLGNALKDFQAIVGVLTTMTSPTAMLVDVMSASAGFTDAELSWSTLIISPRLLLVETRSNNHVWSSNLTAAWHQDPTTAGIKIRYRPSTNTKTIFAQVQATSADIAAVRARKAHAPSRPSLQNPPTLQATISIPVQTCGLLDQWLPMFMQRVATTNNLPLQASTTNSGLDIHKWRAMMAYDGSWTGKVLVQLANDQELRQLHKTLHGQGTEIQHHTAGILVDSDHVDLRTPTTQSS